MGLRAGLDGCGKIRPPTGIRSPDRLDRSESLYRLSYRRPHPVRSSHRNKTRAAVVWRAALRNIFGHEGYVTSDTCTFFFTDYSDNTVSSVVPILGQQNLFEKAFTCKNLDGVNNTVLKNMK